MVGLNRHSLRLFMALFILAGMTLLLHSIASATRAFMRHAIQPSVGDLYPDYLPLAQRSICDPITANTTWTVSASPYRVTCDVIVPAGVTLTIEAGVTVQFEHLENDLIISGTLQAVGTASAPIRFQPSSGTTPGSWGRVATMAGSTGVLDHTILEYGGSSEGMVYIASDAVQVVDSVAQYSANTGIYIQAASPLISGTQILTNTTFYCGGGLYNDTGSPLIQNNTFRGNFTGSPYIEAACGGGLYNGSGNPKIQNNIFIHNSTGSMSGDGGGLYNGSGSPIIQNNIFIGNLATGFDMGHQYAWGSGGGLNNASGNPTIQNNIFTGNSAHYGGGIYNYSGSPTIQNNTFTSNNAEWDGGGLFTGNPVQFETPIIQDNPFTRDNSAWDGGGLSTGGSPTIQNNTFISNSAGIGGGLATMDAAIIQYNTFTSNSAEYGGGLMNRYGSPTIQSNTFTSNSAITGGGGMDNYGTAYLRNNTFFSNSAGQGGGMMNSRTAYLYNNTFSSNRADLGGGILSSGNILITNTIVANSLGDGDCDGAIPDGGHNLDSDGTCGFDPANGSLPNADPLLGPLQDNGGPTWTQSLLTGSPAIDAGDYAQCPVADQRGFYRPVDGDGNGIRVCDIGSFEYGSLGPWGINLIPPYQHEAGLPGDTFTYTFTLFNHSEITDTYSLEVGPHTWATILSTGAIGPLPPTSSQAFTLTVTIPPEAAWYQLDTVLITAASVASPTGYSAAAQIITQTYVKYYLPLILK